MCGDNEGAIQSSRGTTSVDFWTLGLDLDLNQPCVFAPRSQRFCTVVQPTLRQKPPLLAQIAGQRLAKRTLSATCPIVFERAVSTHHSTLPNAETGPLLGLWTLGREGAPPLFPSSRRRSHAVSLSVLQRLRKTLSSRTSFPVPCSLNRACVFLAGRKLRSS